MKTMEHDEAVAIKATERYLLNEMTEEERDEFEQHLFDCAECTLDLRAAAAFLDEAKLQLPELTAQAASPAPARPVKVAAPAEKKPAWWDAWLRPAFAMPAFAALVLVIGYQNVATIPALHTAAEQPRLLPWTSIHGGTRGEAHTQVTANAKQGAVLLIDLPDAATASSLKLDLLDPQGKSILSQAVSATEAGNGTLSLLVPGAALQQGSYIVVISGASAGEAAKEIDRRIFDVHFGE